MRSRSNVGELCLTRSERGTALIQFNSQYWISRAHELDLIVNLAKKVWTDDVARAKNARIGIDDRDCLDSSMPLFTTFYLAALAIQHLLKANVIARRREFSPRDDLAGMLRKNDLLRLADDARIILNDDEVDFCELGAGVINNFSAYSTENATISCRYRIMVKESAFGVYTRLFRDLLDIYEKSTLKTDSRKKKTPAQVQKAVKPVKPIKNSRALTEYVQKSKCTCPVCFRGIEDENLASHLKWYHPRFDTSSLNSTLKEIIARTDGHIKGVKEVSEPGSGAGFATIAPSSNLSGDRIQGVVDVPAEDGKNLSNNRVDSHEYLGDKCASPDAIQSGRFSTCPYCNVTVKAARLDRHIRKLHGHIYESTSGHNHEVSCSVCGIMVDRDVLDSHLKENHANSAGAKEMTHGSSLGSSRRRKSKGNANGVSSPVTDKFFDQDEMQIWDFD